MAEVDMGVRVGGDGSAALAMLEKLGGGVKGFATKAASLFAGMGLLKFGEESVKAAQKLEVANAHLKAAVMATSGTTVQHVKASNDLTKAQDALSKAEENLSKTKLTLGASADASVVRNANAVAKAQEGITKAEIALSNAQSAKKVNAGSVQLAQMRLADAQKALTVAESVGAGASGKAAIAAMKLKDASDKVAAAQAKVKAAMAEGSAPTKNAVIDWKAYQEQMTEVVDKTEEATVFSRRDLTSALANLTQKTGDAAGSLKDMGLMADVASMGDGNGGIVGLGNASTILAKIEDGNIGAAARLLPFLKGVTDKTEALRMVREHAAGQATALGNTEWGTQEKLKNAYERLQETIGLKLLPILTPLLNKGIQLLENFQKMPKPIQDLILGIGGISAAFSVLGPWLSPAGKIIGGLWKLIPALGEATGAEALFKSASIGVQAGALVAAAGVGFMIGQFINSIPAVKAAQKALGEWLANIPAIQNALGGPIAEMTNNTGNLQKLRDEAASSGDWTAYDSAVKALKAQNANRPKAALGGIFNQPYTGGEAGPEAAIPLSNRMRPQAKRLLDTVNQVVGGGASSGGVHFHINGSAADAKAIASELRPIIGQYMAGQGAPIMDFGG